MNSDWTPPSDRWARFDSYEVSNGYIRPAAGAALTLYDPFTSWERDEYDRSDYQPPWQELRDLVRDIDVDAALGNPWQGTQTEMPRLNRQDAKRVLGFVMKWGLLGGALRRCLQIYHPLPDGEMPGFPGVPILRDLSFTRYGGEWLREELEQRVPYIPGVEPEPHMSQIITTSPTVQAFEQQALADANQTWNVYFPGASDIAAVSRPGDEAFWRAYAEPIDHFVREAVLLDKAISGGSLRMFMACCSLDVDTSGDQPVLRWLCGSLSASFAAMAADDMRAGWRVRACRVCSRPFTSKTKHYCSPTCSNTAKKRRQRERQS